MNKIRPVLWLDFGQLPSDQGTTLQRQQAIFSALIDEEDSPFQDALERVSDETVFSLPLIIAPKKYQDQIIEQCDFIDLWYEDLLLVEEEASLFDIMRTASAWMEKRRQTAPLLFCPLPYFIADQFAFLRAVQDAAYSAQHGYFLAFGCVHTHVLVQHHYLEVGMRIEAGFGGHHIKAWAQKDDITALEAVVSDAPYVQNTNFYCVNSKELSHYLSLQDDQSHQCFEKFFMGYEKRAVISFLSACADLRHWCGVWDALRLS